MIALALFGCATAWDAQRTEVSDELVISLDQRETDASFDILADIWLQAADGGDTDTATFDTGWDENTGLTLALAVQVKEATGEGRARFLAWGAQSTDTVPEPVEFGVGERPTVWRTSVFCAAFAGTCSFGQRATVDLREGGPMTVVLRLTLDASADEDSAKYISDQTDYELGFR